MGDARPEGLLDIHRYLCEGDVISFTLARLSERGREGLEAFVLWGARRVGPGELRFTSAVFPRQTAYVTEDGLLVAVDSDALFEVNKLLHGRGEILAGQAHAHPTDAYHSATDDRQPVVTILGGLSVVIPNFASGGVAVSDSWAWFRLRGLGLWDPIPHNVSVEIL